MTSPTPRGRILRAAASPRPEAARRYGPRAGEPPLLVDPRRWGSLVGLVGGMVFIGINSSALGPVATTIAWVAGLAAVVVALFAHYIRPVSLGPLARPRPLALATYCGCVVGEIALIAVGSRALAAVGHSELRPALIAAVVGLHFMPFAWAFRERMFLYLGGAVAVIGAAGLLAGALRVSRAADAAAVGAGLVMLTIITLHALGRFAPASLQQQAE
jgi:hypothetical protein